MPERPTVIQFLRLSQKDAPDFPQARCIRTKIETGT